MKLILSDIESTYFNVRGELLKELQTCFADGTVTKEFCFNKPEVDETIVLELNDCDVWVFAFPLYVGGGGGLAQMKSAPLGKEPKTSLGKTFHTLKNIPHIKKQY